MSLEFKIISEPPTVDANPDDQIGYPCLKRWCMGETVVLFTSSRCGVVIAGKGKSNGEVRTDWIEENFNALPEGTVVMIEVRPKSP